jgi:DNA processing protein
MFAEKLGVTIINIEDKRYPVLLKRITDPPAILYIKGQLQRTDSVAVAIVGSRRCSMYGRQQASRLGYMLSSAGFTVCSGMARGIDSAAHQGALSAGGRTIAVQGCGLANVFPPENEKLFANISESGACISELPLNSEPLSENFPPRNRIIAGMSLATLVIEAGLRSGAMITSKFAADYNREVMAVPGKVDSPLSKGAHQLIKNGAVLVESAEDILDAIGYASTRLKAIAGEEFDKLQKEQIDSQKPKILQLKGDEKKIYNTLTAEPVYIDEVISTVQMPAGRVNAGLVQLQMKGLVKHKSGNYFCRKQLLD